MVKIGALFLGRVNWGSVPVNLGCRLLYLRDLMKRRMIKLRICFYRYIFKMVGPD